MSKKQLSAAQGVQAACILFELNSKTADIINMASGAQMPGEYLSGQGAEMFCAEWRAFVHAVVTAAVMQHAPNTVFLAYLRQTGNLLNAVRGGHGGPENETDEKTVEAALNAFVDGPFAEYMPLLAQEQQVRCPELFCQRLAVQAANLRGQATLPDDRAKARLAAIMAMVISAVWDKLEQYDIQAD